jgi:hypothetical protein
VTPQATAAWTCGTVEGTAMAIGVKFRRRLRPSDASVKAGVCGRIWGTFEIARQFTMEAYVVGEAPAIMAFSATSTCAQSLRKPILATTNCTAQ